MGLEHEQKHRWEEPQGGVGVRGDCSKMHSIIMIILNQVYEPCFKYFNLFSTLSTTPGVAISWLNDLSQIQIQQQQQHCVYLVRLDDVEASAFFIKLWQKYYFRVPRYYTLSVGCGTLTSGSLTSGTLISCTAVL